MDLNEIETLWEEDSSIDKSNIDIESLKIAKLHHKYYKILLSERTVLKKQEITLNKETAIAYNYWKGDYDQTDDRYKRLGAQTKKLTAAEIKIYMDADSILQKLRFEYSMQTNKIDYIIDVLKTINMRGFHLKNVIEWQKFINGGQ